MAYKVIKADFYTYKGELDENDIPCGQGKKIWRGGRVEEGEFEDGELNGQGKRAFNNGIVLEGEFNDGEPNGEGKVTLPNGTVYKSVWEDGWLTLEGICQNGHGKRVSGAGLFEEGEFEDGKLNGQGKITWHDGTIEEGEFEDGEIVYGKITWDDGTVEKGMFDEYGRLNGRGKKVLADGTVYEGVWEDGWLTLEGNCWNGYGKRVSCCSIIDEAEFESGEFEYGELIRGKRTWHDGTIKEGEFDEDGKLNGQGKVTLPNGTVYEGVWENGWLTLEGNCQNGYGKVVSHYGYVGEGQFEDGMLNGQGNQIFWDGTVYEGEFKDGWLNGQGRKISSDGTVVWEGTFKDGYPVTDLPHKTYSKAIPTPTEDDEEWATDEDIEDEIPSLEGPPPSEDTYEGEKNAYGQPHGKGKMTYANGDIYEGSWSYGIWFGKGVYARADGKVYTGVFSDFRKSPCVTEIDGNIRTEGTMLRGEFTPIG